MEDEKQDEPVLALSDSSRFSSNEFSRREQKLQIVQNQLDEKSVMRDVLLSVRKSVECEERVIIGSSSAMLCLVSDYFHSLFDSDVIDKGETLEITDKVTLPGIIALNALAFGVLSRVRLTSKDLASLIAVSLYFKVPSLLELCDEYIIRHNVMNDTRQFSTLIRNLNSLGFTAKADDLIAELNIYQTNQLFLDPSTLNMTCDLFSSLLKCQTLTLDETEIWLCCVEWSQFQASIYDDDALDHLILLKSLIRFPLLSEEFICNHVKPTGLLSSEEYSQITNARLQRVMNDDSSKLFCSMQPRKKQSNQGVKPFWDERSIIADNFRIEKEGSLIKHCGINKRANAMVSGVIINEGSTLIQFQLLSDHLYNSLFLVAQTAGELTLSKQSGTELKRVGYDGYSGHFFKSSSMRKSFGESLTQGDYLTAIVRFLDEKHATLSFLKNGNSLGYPIKLHTLLDVSQQLRFAVRTYHGSRIRICKVEWTQELK